MKKWGRILIFISVMTFIFSGCSSGNKFLPNKYDEAYEKIMKEEKITVKDAYEDLKDANFQDDEKGEFVKELEDLLDCEGEFFQAQEGDDDVYTADISFYLEKGDIKATINYTNYAGTIKDGRVDRMDEGDYDFETQTTGNFGAGQDFHVYYSEDKLHIMWGSISEYDLYRDVETAKKNTPADEEEEDYSSSYSTSSSSGSDFESSAIYQAVKNILDENYADTPHDIYYDSSEKDMYFFIQAPDNTRSSLDLNISSVQESWDKVVTSMTNMNQSMCEVLLTVDEVDTVYLCLVDQVKSASNYTESDFLLIVENGSVIYRYK